MIAVRHRMVAQDNRVPLDVEANFVTHCIHLKHPSFGHFFDTIYYPVLDATVGRPYALYVHGNSDTTGAVRSVETITTGLKWTRLREPLTLTGGLDAAAREACWELGATTAASLMST